MEDKYLYMIQKAQEFMNENHFADVSRVQCLLRKMMSKEYHGLIDQIKECQVPMLSSIFMAETISLRPLPARLSKNWWRNLLTR